MFIFLFHYCYQQRLDQVSEDFDLRNSTCTCSCRLSIDLVLLTLSRDAPTFAVRALTFVATTRSLECELIYAPFD
jgi:hypothetical protein